MKDFVAVLKNENGHFLEAIGFFFTIIILFLVLLPSLQAYRTEAVNRLIEIETRCFENLLTIIQDNKITEKQCPLSNKPYRINHVASQEILTCSAPENHKWIMASFVKKEQGWELVEKEGELGFNDGHYSLAATSGKIDLTIQPEKIIINAESNFIIRYLVAPYHSLGFWGRLILGVVVWAVVLFSLRHGTDILDNIFIVMLLFLFANGIILAIYGDTDGVYSQKITEISRTDFTITETNRIFFKQEQPEIISDIQAVLTGKDHNDILVLYGREQLKSKRIILRVDKNEKLHPKAVLSQVIYQSQK